MSGQQRLRLLRRELSRRGLDGFVVPLTDENLSEYVGTYARRLEWLTGFRGSSGSAIVLASKAAIFVDGRYTLQVREQVDEQDWSYHSKSEASVGIWLKQYAPDGGCIGYDPWLHTKAWVVAARDSLSERRAKLVPVDGNPIDAVWTDRPLPSNSKLALHPDGIAGKSSAEKRRDIAAWLNAVDADAVIVTALDSIAWTFNIRGQDIPRSPVALAYATIYADSSADLFVAPQKLTDEVERRLGTNVRFCPRDSFLTHLAGLANKKIVVDPERTVDAIYTALEGARANVIECRDPVILPKAIKNSTEIAGHKAAQARDGAALSRFLHWFSIEAPKGALSELSAAARLEEFRRATGLLRDLSFDTISAAGPNSAKPHYRVTSESNRPIESGTLYLVDSGGQYDDGTTDVTRTIAVGVPSAEMRDRFTRVLKGHIAIASATFPVGTRGSQLDVLARQFLWAAGLDYAHGTGHGVGSYLLVHEGPQRIFNTSTAPDAKDEPLAPGMILSNEPGYYKFGEYGIRIENLVLVVEREIVGAGCTMLGFETLTFAPIDRTLIEVAMLTREERAWINLYHAEVARTIAPQLRGSANEWLVEATRVLE